MPLLITISLLCLVRPAAAHVVQAGSTEWNWDPWIVAPIALAALGYAAGVDRLRARSARRPLLPDMHLSEPDARDVTAYLYTLR